MYLIFEEMLKISFHFIPTIHQRDFFLLIVFALGHRVFAVTNFEGKIFLLRQPGEVITIKKGRRRDGSYPKLFGSFIYFIEKF